MNTNIKQLTIPTITVFNIINTQKQKLTFNYKLIFFYILSLLLLLYLPCICYQYYTKLHFKHPSIIASEKELNLISNWINPNHSFKYTLLYRASANNDTVESFHEKCDYKQPTLTLVSTRKGDLEDILILLGK